MALMLSQLWNFRRFGRPALLALAALSLQHAALAQSQDDKAPTDSPPTRRSGFFATLGLEASLAAADGSPNDLARRDNPAEVRHTGFGFGSRRAFVIGVAPTDWLNLGIGGAVASSQTSTYRSDLASFIFHLEAFPLFAKGGSLRDLGVALDFGAGSSKAELRSTGEEVASTSVVSIIGAGAFWEPVRFWHFALGPRVGYERAWSRNYSRDDISLGLRLAFYGGP